MTFIERYCVHLKPRKNRELCSRKNGLYFTIFFIPIVIFTRVDLIHLSSMSIINQVSD